MMGYLHLLCLFIVFISSLHCAKGAPNTQTHNEDLYSNEDEDYYDSVKTGSLTGEELRNLLFEINSRVLNSENVLTICDKKHQGPQENLKNTNIALNHESASGALEASNKIYLDQLQSDQPYQNFNAEKHEQSTPKSQHNQNEFAVSVSKANADEPQTWSCQFQSNQMCGLINDPATGQLFQLKNVNFFAFSNFNWPSWYLLLNTSAVSINTIGSRLITSYFPTKNVQTGCLTLEYIITGDDIDKIMVYQQDSDNHCIWTSPTLANSPLLNPTIVPVNLSVDLSKGDPRFFIEVYLKNKHYRKGVFALAHIRMAYKSCYQNNANQCQPQTEPNTVIP